MADNLPARVEPEAEHVTDSDDCWCGPEVVQPCLECPVGPGNVMPNPDCWRCNGRGLVPPYDDEAPSVIIHNTADEIIEGAGL